MPCNRYSIPAYASTQKIPLMGVQNTAPSGRLRSQTFGFLAAVHWMLEFKNGHHFPIQAGDSMRAKPLLPYGLYLSSLLTTDTAAALEASMTS